MKAVACFAESSVETLFIFVNIVGDSIQSHYSETHFFVLVSGGVWGRYKQASQREGLSAFHLCHPVSKATINILSQHGSPTELRQSLSILLEGVLQAYANSGWEVAAEMKSVCQFRGTEPQMSSKTPFLTNFLISTHISEMNSICLSKPLQI